MTKRKPFPAKRGSQAFGFSRLKLPLPGRRKNINCELDYDSFMIVYNYARNAKCSLAEAVRQIIIWGTP